MSRDNLGNKHSIIIHNCLINDNRYDLVITPHRQSVGYIRTKTKTLRTNKNKLLEKKFKTKKRSLRIRNKHTRISQFKKLNKQNHQIDDQLYFTDSEPTSPASIKVERRIKNCYTNKPIRLHNWNRLIRHIENYKLTVYNTKMIQNEDNSENSVLPFLISSLTEARGHEQLCQN